MFSRKLECFPERSVKCIPGAVSSGPTVNVGVSLCSFDVVGFPAQFSNSLDPECLCKVVKVLSLGWKNLFSVRCHYLNFTCL